MNQERKQNVFFFVPLDYENKSILANQSPNAVIFTMIASDNKESDLGYNKY